MKKMSEASNPERTSYVETVTQIRIAMAEMNVKLDQVKDVSRDLVEVSKVANAAEQSTSSAHKRIDAIEEGQKWLWRTVMAGVIVSAIGLVFAVIKLGLLGKAAG
jgi:hypothetical protein